LGEKLVPNKTYSLEQFAYRKQAPVDAITNIVINVVILLVGLWGLDFVDVVPQPPPTGSFTHSLFGSLFPMAIMTTMITTIMGVRVTVKKRIAGEVTPSLNPDVRWFKATLGTAILRAFAAFGLVSMFGLIVHYESPQATISVRLAAVVVAGLAAMLAYVESVAAVLKTRDLGYASPLGAAATRPGSPSA
jgi:hypothetical protein